MKEVKIQLIEDGEWTAVPVVDDVSRPGWVQIQEGEETRWLSVADVHPADQIALQVEMVARQRYEWVSKSDFDDELP